MRLPFAAIAAALWIIPLQAQTSGPSGIQGVESDDFSPVMKINGVVQSDNPLGGIAKRWSLRSFVGKFSGVTKHQLYVSLDYFSAASRKRFNEASDNSATRLEVTSIANESEYGCSKNAFAYGCHYSQDLGIELAAEALRAHAAAGYPIKVTAKSGESFILVISPGQIAAQLDTVERCLKYVHAHNDAAPGPQGPQLTKHSQLGFKASEITDELSAKTGMQKGPGIVVFEVTPGSVAERAGLKVKDRIMAVAGCGPRIDSKAAMQKCLARKKAYIGMVVDRGGNLTAVGMKLYAEGN
ncbi:MAG: PDZ domain-containing protein [Methylocapsa sp.]|nr:PDZ domain-containing protein [Methylocapsa sp.]